MWWYNIAIASSFYGGLALRIYFDSINANSLLTALFGVIYVDAAPKANTWWDILLGLTLAKCAGFSTWPPAVAMLCLMRLRIQRNLRGVNDFTVFNRTLVKRIGPHVTHGLAAYTTRPVLAWWIAAHLALGPWGTPALLHTLNRTTHYVTDTTSGGRATGTTETAETASGGAKRTAGTASGPEVYTSDVPLGARSGSTKVAKRTAGTAEQDQADYDAYVELRRERLCAKFGC